MPFTAHNTSVSFNGRHLGDVVDVRPVRRFRVGDRVHSRRGLLSPDGSRYEFDIVGAIESIDDEGGTAVVVEDRSGGRARVRLAILDLILIEPELDLGGCTPTRERG